MIPKATENKNSNENTVWPTSEYQIWIKKNHSLI